MDCYNCGHVFELHQSSRINPEMPCMSEKCVCHKWQESPPQYTKEEREVANGLKRRRIYGPCSNWGVGTYTFSSDESTNPRPSEPDPKAFEPDMELCRPEEIAAWQQAKVGTK